MVMNPMVESKKSPSTNPSITRHLKKVDRFSCQNNVVEGKSPIGRYQPPSFLKLKHLRIVFSKNTLPETNSSHLKMDGWNTSFLLGRPILRRELLVSGRVSSHF